jgi:hypothetical protein
MRTTVRLDGHLSALARRRAVETGRALTAVLEEALRESLQRQAGRSKRTPVKLTTVKGSGLRAGVDLEDTAALLEAMES